MSISSILKTSSNLVRIRMWCPAHSSSKHYMQLTIPTYEKAAGLLKKHTLLCRQCGLPVELTGTVTTRNPAKVVVHCITHGEGDREITASLLTAFQDSPITAEDLPRICSSCGKTVNAEFVFCPFCGQKNLISQSTPMMREKIIERERVFIRCPFCNAKQEEGTKVCTNCQASI